MSQPKITDEKLVIKGAVPLKGELSISGAKNSVLKVMAAALLTHETVEIHNVPHLSDVSVMASVLEDLGAHVEHLGNVMRINAAHINNTKASYELVSKMRASFIVLGALLGRCGEALVPLPGGCSIGKRSVDLHIRGLQALGAELKLDQGYVDATCAKLIGREIMLDVPSVGATENLLLAATLAEGTTVISNAAQEPEIIDLVNFLNAIGANISGEGTSEIIIHGVKQSDLHGASFAIMPDRIETATYMIAAAGTRGNVVLHQVVPGHLTSVIRKLEDMGISVITEGPNTLRVIGSNRLEAQNIVTQPYPGFPTDIQAPFMPLLAIADGVSIITETVYENRFKHIGELKRMGANIQPEGNVAIINGGPPLMGTQVNASDLRAGAALIIAGLIAEGTTEISGLHHIDRGYERVVEKLSGIGACIKRVKMSRSDLAQVAASPVQ
ncbi:MAG: UDP-N-acetylglucosamine 1-carboxyvinyltransferase [Vampirovibrionales bacterium]